MVGFEPTSLRSGALSHRLRPLGHTVHVMLLRCEHDGFCHWLVRGKAPHSYCRGPPHKMPPSLQNFKL